MLIRFCCDSDITFSRGLHKNLVTVLYFSIINVLCGAGRDASFVPEANLVYSDIFFQNLRAVIYNKKFLTLIRKSMQSPGCITSSKTLQV